MTAPATRFAERAPDFRCGSGKNQTFTPTRPLSAIPSERLRYLAERIHCLGTRPLFELFCELADGADLDMRLEAYAALAPLAPFIAEMGGDRLQRPRVVSGGRQ
jgi:hypothetical protein